MVDLVEIFKALSNKNRMDIYRTIRIRTIEIHEHPESTRCCVSDICREYKITPSTISHHLKELRHAGLIDMEREGQFFNVSANEEVFNEIKKFFDEIDEW